MNKRTPVQTLLLVVGAVVFVGGLVCLVSGFAAFGSTDPGSDDNSAMMLFAAGGFGMVIGFGIVAFTRSAILTGNGGYSRITIEQGVGPGGGRFCPSCGARVTPAARFCESCGHAVG